jgi:hypothetical protein
MPRNRFSGGGPDQRPETLEEDTFGHGPLLRRELRMKEQVRFRDRLSMLQDRSSRERIRTDGGKGRSRRFYTERALARTPQTKKIARAEKAVKEAFILWLLRVSNFLARF